MPKVLPYTADYDCMDNETLTCPIADSVRLRHRRQLKEKLLKLHLDDGEVLKLLMSITAMGEDLSALYVIPLVGVAWADSSMHPDERAAILPIVKAEGVRCGSAGERLLKHWLETPPTPEVLDAWNDYVRACSASMSTQVRDTFRRDLYERAHSVAQAAGGIFGFGNKVCQFERKVLDEMERVFA